MDARTPTGTYDYLVDGLGSVVALVNSSGTVVNRYHYDPYGNIVSETQQVANPFRWIGAGVRCHHASLQNRGALV